MIIKNFKKDEGAIELPINIVVMLVVGMVALAALIAIIPKSKEYLTVDVIDITIDNKTTDGSIVAVRGDGEYEVRANVKVYDKENNPVTKASVTLSGGGGFGTDQTNNNGEAIVKLGTDNNYTKVTIRPNQKSVELKLVAKANGFFDYENENAIQINNKN